MAFIVDAGLPLLSLHITMYFGSTSTFCNATSCDVASTGQNSETAP
jgi:hypothetical protein